MTTLHAATPPITARSVILGLLFSLALCAMNSYLTLSFGVIEEGPTIAALFFFALMLPFGAKSITSTEMVIVATMGSAGGGAWASSRIFMRPRP
ncbi:MAG: OPT/YSL family transporter [Planctomycetes bacterium]|nr:OPT/YSL family transporter [Planctomycetota bacterium]